MEPRGGADACRWPAGRTGRSMVSNPHATGRRSHLGDERVRPGATRSHGERQHGDVRSRYRRVDRHRQLGTGPARRRQQRLHACLQPARACGPLRPDDAGRARCTSARNLEHPAGVVGLRRHPPRIRGICLPEAGERRSVDSRRCARQQRFVGTPATAPTQRSGIRKWERARRGWRE
jgi:hypothetical protein